ncbi:TetR/AcrR family transcriptional regulator [Microbacterium sp. Nx66]|uniref:TetR/AcrR family transcriptional regulator n=1 Tax=Microbacterium sp. Nx66 TaxID=2766784 RepID=UPI0016570C3B|nr:TetR/AcrR family transcriptional regulator [Microbacterium sp. Nx66]CAD5140407.1 TetR/AcrR family transcriptional regulator [Microbacterium sp. Nx66]
MPPAPSEDSERPRPRGAYAKGVARRQEILDRAIEVFAARGADRTSLRAIAKAVGVTHAALTHYFGSLEELLVAVYVESNAPERKTDPEPANPVEGMIRSARANREVPGLVPLYSTLVASALEEGHPAARRFATERFARLRADIAETVREQQKDGSIRTDVDPLAVAALVVAASDGLQTQWLLDDTAPQHEALALLDRLLRPTDDAGREGSSAG